MTLPRIGNAKELDPIVIANHQIVAIFGICDNTLCIHAHALMRYHSRQGAKISDFPVLEKLYYSLSISQIANRKNEANQIAKHGYQKVMYRFEDGWIFILVWIEKFDFWLMKTAYPKADRDRRWYGIPNTRKAIRASAWSPPLP